MPNLPRYLGQVCVYTQVTLIVNLKVEARCLNLVAFDDDIVALQAWMSLGGLSIPTSLPKVPMQLATYIGHGLVYLALYM